MKVAIVGPGRVGTLLAQVLPQAGHRVVAVVGGSPQAQDRFASRVAGVRRTDLAEAADRADLLLLCTPDPVVETVVRTLAAGDLVAPRHRVVHLAGSLGLSPLRLASLAGAGVAAIHPAQTVPDDAAVDALQGAAWAVTASASDRGWAHDLVADLGGDPRDVRDEDRARYHAALVLASNAVAAALSAASQLLRAVHLENPEAFLGALAHRSVDNVLASGAAAITGPVVRGDVDALARHLAALDPALPELAETYRHLQRAVVCQSAPGRDVSMTAALHASLADPDQNVAP
jgi:predicted short-subunit dehydrogenase-like oxidoreductase (DUF2520 family)